MPGDGRSPEAVLSDMAAGLSTTPDAIERSEAGDGAALCIKTWRKAGSFHVDGDVIVALEGYPYWSSPQLERVAAEAGHAAALAAAYRDNGTALFGLIHGPFSFAVVDRKRRTALLAIDRVGIHPMCFAELPGKGLVFGSTADAVRAHPGVTATITAQAVFNYLNFFVSPAPQTVYREQRKLLIGQYALYTPDRLQTAFYANLSYCPDEVVDIETLSAELMERLQVSVHRATGSEHDAEIGAFLSGGLDSTTVCGLLGRVNQTRRRSFTIGFEEKKFDERAYARIGARHFDFDYHEYILSPQDTLALLPRLAATYDEPFGNSSAIPAYYCARLAREAGIDLMLAGDGGDEIFAGNARYAQQQLYELYGHIPALLRTMLVKPIAGASRGAERLSFFRRLRSYVMRAEIPLPDRLQCWSMVANTDFFEMFDEEFAAHLDPDEPNRFMRETYFRTASDSSLHRMLHLDLQMILADGDLRKVVKMCDLAGVRVKFPMLDEGLMEFSTRIPPSLLIKGRKLRYFYKFAMGEFLPAEILTKHKHGFGMPFDDWLRNDADLQQLAYDSLTSFKARGYLKPSFIDRVIAAHRAGSDGSAGDLTWDIMSLELWLRAH